jgi:Ca2+-binding RTX toxin-like protein
MAIQPISISRSGGVEGSSEVLTLRSTGGGVLNFQYEHYGIPDRFMIRYEGKLYLDTGFIGGNRSGSFLLPAGKSKTIELITATNDPGTAWVYSVSFLEAAIRAPEPYVITAATGEFTRNANKMAELVNATSDIGRSDGITSMLRTVGGSVLFTPDADPPAASEIIDVRSSTVYARIGGVGRALFQGSFIYDMNTHRTRSLLDTNALAGEFQLAGIDVTFIEMALEPQRIRSEIEFTLPQQLGGAKIATKLLNDVDLVIDQNGARFDGEAEVVFPDIEFDIGALEFEMERGRLRYNSGQDAIFINGEIELEGLLRDGNDIVIDMTDDDSGIRYSNGQISVKGSGSVEEPIKLGKFELSNIEVEFDTAAALYTAGMDVTLPFMKTGIGATVGIITTPKFAFNTIEVRATNLDFRLPTTMPVWLESIGVGLRNFAGGSTEPLTAVGTAEFGILSKTGTRFGVNGYLGYIDAELTIDGNAAKGTADFALVDEKIFKGSGSLELNWTSGHLTARLAVDIGNGILVGDGFIRLATNGMSIGGSAEVKIGSLIAQKFNIPFLSSADIAVKYSGTFTVDGNNSNDFVEFAAEAFGKDIGFRFNLNTGGITTVGVDSIKSLEASGGYSGTATATAFTRSFAFSGDGDDGLVTIRWRLPAPDVQLQVIRPDGRIISESAFAANGITYAADAASSTTAGLIIKDPSAGLWKVQVLNAAALQNVDVRGYETTAVSALRMLSVTTLPDGNVAVKFSNAGLDPNARIQLFFDSDAVGFNGLAATGSILAKSLPKDAAGNPILLWDTSTAPVGNFNIYATVSEPTSLTSRAYWSAPVAVTKSADVSISLTTSAAGFQTNDTVTYDIVVKNNGSAIARNVSLDFKDDEGTYIASTSSNLAGGYSIGTDLTQFKLDDLVPGEEFRGTVSLYAGFNTGSKLDVSAAVATTSFQRNTTNDTASLQLDQGAPNGASVRIATKLIAAPRDADDEYIYQVSVRNDGLVDAQNVMINVTSPGMPKQVTGAGNIVTVTSGQTSGFNVNLATLEAGEAQVWVVRGTGQQIGTFNITARVDHTGNDLDLRNDISNLQFEILPAPPPSTDLKLDMAWTQGFEAGRSFLTVTLTNQTTAIAEGVVVGIRLPPGVLLENASAGQGTYDATTGLWDVGNLIDNGVKTLRFDVGSTGTRTIVAEILESATKDLDSRPDNAVVSEDDYATATLTSPVVNRAPTGLTLSNTRIAENANAFTTIGTLDLIDPDVGQAENFRLVSSPSGLFEISGNELLYRSGADYEAAATHSLVIEGSDRFGMAIRKTFIISVTDVNGVTITGSNAPDSIGYSQVSEEEDLIDGRGGDDVLQGFGGNDTFNGRGGSDRIFGGTGNDLIVGDTEGDQLYGESGNDTIYGDAGGDYIDGGSEFDWAAFRQQVKIDRTTPANNTGEAVGDTYNSIEAFALSSFNDSYIGNSGNDVVAGQGGNDMLDGLGGNDSLIGGIGADTLSGGDNDDTLNGGDGPDVLLGGLGRDTAVYSLSAKVNQLDRALNAGEALGDILSSIEVFNFGAQADRFQGSRLSEAVYGGAGVDTLLGGEGNDTIVGGANKDYMAGQTGRDVFAFDSIFDSSSNLAFADVITDFKTTDFDLIDLSAIDARPLLDNDQAFVFIGSAAFTGAGQVRAIVSGTSTIVELNLDGDAIAEMLISLTGAKTLTAANFIL